MSAAKGGGSSRKGRRPALSAEDRSLWDHVAASVEKGRSGKPRVPDVEPPQIDQPEEATPPARASLHRGQTRTPRTERPAKREAAPLPPSPLPRSASAAAEVPGVDRRKARRIATGAIEIEARLDLHGMTQSAAHARLIGFVQSAAAKGMRTVLVITGKGGARQQPPSGGAWWESEEIGILRRSVPRWLAEAPLRAVVIGCQPAAPRHGGEGALYVLLRRGKSADRK